MYKYEYPDLIKEKVLSIDIETCDPYLEESGPGVYRKDGYILGVSVATTGGFAEYYNLGHPDCTKEEREINLAYITSLMNSQVPKLGVNLLYDIDWLQNFQGIEVKGNYNDIQVAEPLLNEYAWSYSLETLCQKYLGIGKAETEIEQYCNENGFKGKPQKWLYKMPSSLVRKYAIADVVLPIRIFEQQYKKLKEEGLVELYKKEMRLYPMLLKMRQNGVRIDVKYVDDQTEEITYDIEDRRRALDNKIGYKVNFNSTQQLAKLFDSLDLPYPYKEPTDLMRKKGITRGNPSIDKDYMETLDHPIVTDLLMIRKLEKALNTFFINSFTKSRVKDRIHASFFPLRNDEFGTVTGRFSSANPNLQQIPAKDKIIGPLCRRAFIAEEGKGWFKLDFSQVEYRIIAHYAQGEGSDNIRKRYNENPDTDYHQEIMDLTGLDRKPAKNLNFGLGYGMGPPTGAKKFGWSLEYAQEVFALYHEKVPFVRETSRRVGKKAIEVGHIKTVLGRIARLDDPQKSYKMFNKLIQGSAADIMKESMIIAYEEGLFDVLDIALTVHDELDGSYPLTDVGLKALWRLKEIMQTCVKLRVPLKADLEIGKNWADLIEINSYESLVENTKSIFEVTKLGELK